MGEYAICGFLRKEEGTKDRPFIGTTIVLQYSELYVYIPVCKIN
jgi:hypothetical protein